MKGNIIFITSDIPHSMEKILPQEQQLFPVSFKRKLTYEGHYIEEIIDKEKIRIIFDWLRKNNHLYYDVLLKDEIIDEFIESTRKEADRFEENNAPKMSIPEDEIEKDTMDEVPIGKQFPSVMINKYEENLTESSIPNRISDMIVDFEVKNRISNNDYRDEAEIEDFFDESGSEEDSEDEPIPESTTPKKKTKFQKLLLLLESMEPSKIGERTHFWKKNVSQCCSCMDHMGTYRVV